MRIAVEAVDVGVGDAVLDAVNREVAKRAGGALFAGVRDLRLRLRQAKGALLCVAVVGFAGGGLVTATGTSDSPLDAIVLALDGLPERIDRVCDARAEAAPAFSSHAAVRQELKRLLERA